VSKKMDKVYPICELAHPHDGNCQRKVQIGADKAIIEWHRLEDGRIEVLWPFTAQATNADNENPLQHTHLWRVCSCGWSKRFDSVEEFNLEPQHVHMPLVQN
jgi:hypothetical protein